LWHIENRTPEEEKLFDLLILLSEHFNTQEFAEAVSKALIG
jgi:hypothetical protein